MDSENSPKPRISETPSSGSKSHQVIGKMCRIVEMQPWVKFGRVEMKKCRGVEVWRSTFSTFLHGSIIYTDWTSARPELLRALCGRDGGRAVLQVVFTSCSGCFQISMCMG